jgi:hypothetical protein
MTIPIGMPRNEIVPRDLREGSKSLLLVEIITLLSLSLCLPLYKVISAQTFFSSTLCTYVKLSQG